MQLRLVAEKQRSIKFLLLFKVLTFPVPSVISNLFNNANVLKASESRIVASSFKKEPPELLLLKGVLHFKIKNVKTRVTFSSSLKLERNIPTMTDFILGVSDPKHWHSENLKLNKNHYASWMVHLVGGRLFLLLFKVLTFPVPSVISNLIQQCQRFESIRIKNCCFKVQEGTSRVAAVEGKTCGSSQNYTLPLNRFPSFELSYVAIFLEVLESVSASIIDYDRVGVGEHFNPFVTWNGKPGFGCPIEAGAVVLSLLWLGGRNFRTASTGMRWGWHALVGVLDRNEVGRGRDVAVSGAALYLGDFFLLSLV
ncbi:hypothetical protein PIB30_025495 [Stylosanthes scabra]|uniref:Phosphatidate cytidylyltransferase, mitochondrial n=1 Tax=Stylosanthes scabra TaxID=79078 RepID=A0ABU6XA91_9FABA|nr:hypothetical protein [Stylosanthes scabra]